MTLGQRLAVVTDQQGQARIGRSHRIGAAVEPRERQRPRRQRPPAGAHGAALWVVFGSDVAPAIAVGAWLGLAGLGAVFVACLRGPTRWGRPAAGRQGVGAWTGDPARLALVAMGLGSAAIALGLTVLVVARRR